MAKSFKKLFRSKMSTSSLFNFYQANKCINFDPLSSESYKVLFSFIQDLFQLKGLSTKYWLQYSIICNSNIYLFLAFIFGLRHLIHTYMSMQKMLALAFHL